MAKTKIEKIYAGIVKYQFLRKRLYETDVALDNEFQRAFNGFFRMGRRTAAYYNDYFDYLQQHKHTDISFAEVVKFLYERHGRLEMSFASKMVAIVCPQHPIWDSVVTKGHFGIVAPHINTQNRLEKGIEKYQQYCRSYEAYMLTDDAKIKILEFEKLFPGIDITKTKKLDFMLWQER